MEHYEDWMKGKFSTVAGWFAAKPGEPVAIGKPGPVEVSIEGSRGRPANPPPCQSCGGPCIWMSGGTLDKPLVSFCNQCHAVDGVVASSETGCEPWCPGFLPQICAGRTKCGNCGRYHDRAPAGVGMSRAELTARQSIFGCSFGKFH
jgi:hypothetical protein